MSTDNEAQVKKAPLWCSSRMGLAIVGFFGFVNLYALRVNMSVAMVCMVNQTAVQKMAATSSYDSHVSNGSTLVVDVPVAEDRCSAQVVNGNASAPTDSEGEFVWDKETQGLILGSFFWGYLVTQIPGGWLAARFGGKRIFGWCMLGTALATLLSPIAARTHHVFLMVLRFIAGLGEGVVWPAMHGMWAYWSPPMERSTLIGFTFAGSQIGNVVTFPLSALLCEYGFDGGWPSVFYVFGGLGVVWFIAWMIFAYDRPSYHPRISDDEKFYIQDSLKGQMDDHATGPVPWKSFFTSKPVWAILIAHTCGNFGTYTFLTNIPTYMREVLKFNIKANGAISALPYIGFWAVINISGFLCDHLRSKNIVTTTTARKIFTTAGQAVPALLAIITGFIDCTQAWAAVLCLSIGVSFIGCLYGAGVMVNHADIAPKYASILFGISNTVATVPGFVAPYVIGKITATQSPSEWRIVFFITAAIYAVGIIGYLLLASGELQPWAEDKSKSFQLDDLKKKDSANALLSSKDTQVVPNEQGDSAPLNKDVKV